MPSYLWISLLVSLSFIVVGQSTRPDECQLPAETGPCRALLPSFYFNSTTYQCEQFNYGGCDGNANRFSTEEECRNHCGDEATNRG